MMRKNTSWKTSDKFRTFECGDGKVRVRFYPFILFHDVMKNEEIVRGILTVSSYYEEEAHEWLNHNPFKVLTKEYAYYTGSSGASDNQPVYSYPIHPGSMFTNSVFLPRSWHVTMYGKLLWEEIYHIAEIGKEKLISSCKEKLGRLLKAYKLEFSVMAFGSRNVISEPNYQIVEHGIPFRTFLKERLEEIRKIKDFLPAGYIHLDNEQSLSFTYDPIGENVFVILYENNKERRYWWAHGHPYIYSKNYMVTGGKDGRFIFIRKRMMVMPKEYWTGGMLQDGSAHLFEEGQPLAYLSLRFSEKPEELAQFLSSMEDNRLGDLIFLLNDPRFSFLKRVSWEDLKTDEKICITEFENSYVVCHRKHGCITVNKALVPYRFMLKR